jgi:hypothetical protein
LAPEVGFGGSSPVFEAIQSQFTWVIKQTLALLARSFSVRFAGNSAGTHWIRLKSGIQTDTCNKNKARQSFDKWIPTAGFFNRDF